ncbi:MAG: tetratricopeptide repeat protein [Psychrobacter sp.]|nr:tetratricopeptide repeat protein [Psychrobacter sp.]
MPSFISASVPSKIRSPALILPLLALVTFTSPAHAKPDPNSDDATLKSNSPNTSINRVNVDSAPSPIITKKDRLTEAANAQFYMGTLKMKAGDLDQAKTLLSSSIESFEKLKMTDTIQYNTALAALGNVVQQRGNYEQAQSYYDKALSSIASIEDRETRAMLNSVIYLNIGLLKSQIGNSNEALSYFKKAEKAAANASAAFNQNPLYLGKLHNNIALAYFNLSRYQLALEEFSRAQNYFGDEIKDTYEQAMILNNLAMVYDALGDSPKAITYFEKVLAMPVINDHQIDTANILTNLSLSHMNLGQDDKAEPYLNKALAIMKDIAPNHPQVVTIYNYLGSIYINREDWQAALDSLQASERLSKVAYGRHYFTGVVDKANIAAAYMGLNDYDRAEQYLKEALTLSQQPDYIEDSNTAMLYSMLAIIDQSNDKPDEALKYYQEALRVNQKFFGEHHQLVASSYNDIAIFYYNQDDLPQSLAYLKKAEASISKAKTVDPFYLASIYEGFQNVYEALGDKAMAKRYADKLAKLN